MRKQLVVVVEKRIEIGIDDTSADAERAPGRCMLANDVHLDTGFASEFSGQTGMLAGKHNHRSGGHRSLIEHAANRAPQGTAPLWQTLGPYDDVYRLLHYLLGYPKGSGRGGRRGSN